MHWKQSWAGIELTLLSLFRRERFFLRYLGETRLNLEKLLGNVLFNQIGYLNSNRDFLEAQFKRMAFPGRVFLHLGKTIGGCLWHPIKPASQSPICL